MLNHLRPADKAWLTLLVGVAAWECCAPPGELLSQSIDRHLAKHPVLVSAVIAVTAAHLLNLLERLPLCWIDPYGWLGKLKGDA